MQQFSLGEMATPILVFGDIQAGTVNKTLVEYFFGKFDDPNLDPVHSIDCRLISHVSRKWTIAHRTRMDKAGERCPIRAGVQLDTNNQ